MGLGEEMGAYSYWSAVTDAASISSWDGDSQDSLISLETDAENYRPQTNFWSFANQYTERLLPLISWMRPEFQEIFIEYYILQKPQAFIAKTHGEIQTRVWQQLRVVEMAIGACLVFGPRPSAETLHDILEAEGIELTESGRLSDMIAQYAKHQSYTKVADACGVPVPAIRKIFRPAIKQLLSSKKVKSIAAGAYLRSLTHQASLTESGIAKSSVRRLHRVRSMSFKAPISETSALMDYGPVDELGDKPWVMFELSPEARVGRILERIQKVFKKIFGKDPVQIFAPTGTDGDLLFGYLLARSTSMKSLKRMISVWGISEAAVHYTDADGEGDFIEVPNEDIQKQIESLHVGSLFQPKVGDFVRVLTGEAKSYCGEVTSKDKVTVMFPTGRVFHVRIVPGSTEKVKAPKNRQAFWGVIPPKPDSPAENSNQPK